MVDKLEEFTWCVAPELNIVNQPRINVAKFGDGYEQRAPDGIHNNLRTFDIEITKKNNEITEILDFIKQKNGLIPFAWIIPKLNERVIVKCASWQITLSNITTKINATFTELTGEGS